jgi:hypothetical protein
MPAQKQSHAKAQSRQENGWGPRRSYVGQDGILRPRPEGTRTRPSERRSPARGSQLAAEARYIQRDSGGDWLLCGFAPLREPLFPGARP